MEPLRNLVVGLELDPSGRHLGEGSARALTQAIDIARRTFGKATLVHSTEAAEHVMPTAQGRLWLTREGVGPEGMEALERARLRVASAGIAAALELSELAPEAALISVAQREGADAVLVGTREHNLFEFDHRKLGNVALRVLRDCPVPVWTVAPDGNRTVARVLAACDRSAMAPKVLTAAAELARLYQATLHVVHACALGLKDVLRGPSARARAKIECSRVARTNLEEMTAGLTPRASLHITCAAPTEAILDHARDTEADVIVLGSVARRGVGGMLVGNTAERLFQLSDRPLFVVKPDDWTPRATRAALAPRGAVDNAGRATSG
jgi:nucleotide-binding universal stress UspA family protein